MLITIKNSQINSEKKFIISSLWKVFLDFFASTSPGTMVILMENVFSDNTPWNIFKISEKTEFKVKTVFKQNVEAETFRNSQNHKKPWNSTLVPRSLKIFNIKNWDKKTFHLGFFYNFMNPLILARKLSQPEMTLSRKSENFMMI